MNLSLHDPITITSDYPSTLTTTLSYGHSTSLQLSACSHYLASGLLDGTILIIDTWTNNAPLVLRGHTRAITGIRWLTENGGLVSWSRDWKVCVWDDNGQLVFEDRFEGGVWGVAIISSINTKNWKLIMDLVDGSVGFVECVDGKINCKYLNDKLEENGVTLCSTVVFNGKYVLNGTNKGWLNIVNVDKSEIAKSFKICSGNIKGIEIVEKSGILVINASDRILRQYDVNLWNENNVENWELSLIHKYQDVVNRIQWNSIKFNNTGEFLCASTMGATHDVYVWETEMGSLVKILEGSNEELIDIDWNHRKCVIVANGMDTGTIYWWGVIIPQKWSALAPDFEEIEQNINYDEKEDEFDMVDYDGEAEAEEGEDQIVDVVEREETDARGFPFIRGCIITTDLRN